MVCVRIEKQQVVKPPFSEKSRRVIARALEVAERQRVNYITTDQLVWGLMQDDGIQEMIQLANLEGIRTELNATIVKTLGTRSEGEIMCSETTDKVLERAGEVSRERGACATEPIDILAAVFLEDCTTAQMLERSGVNFDTLKSFLSHPTARQQKP